MGERKRHFVFFSEPSDVQGAQGLGEKPPSFPSAVLGFNPQSRHILEYLITIGYCWGRGGGGGTWVFFGWACAARDSKLAPRAKKNFP